MNRLVVDMGLFAATVALAGWQGWEAGDLLWSLWLASLVLGYAFLLTAIFGKPVREALESTRNEPRSRPLALLVADDRWTVAETLIGRYWPFLLFSAIAMAPRFREALTISGRKAMMLPYRNVIRMHLMIFVIAGLSAAGARGWILYVALFAYFFPFEVLKRRSALATTTVPR